MNIAIADTDAQINACFLVMRELRPHIAPGRFVPIVRDLQRDGYNLAYIEDGGQVRAVAGFRFKRTLFCDNFLYVDDLVTSEQDRSKGYGKRLLEWLMVRARAAGCAQLHLDSGIRREDAHRFYKVNGLTISGYHFRVDLQPRIPWSDEGAA